jgi:hypothetical protein
MKRKSLSGNRNGPITGRRKTVTDKETTSRVMASWEVQRLAPFDSEHWLFTGEVRNVGPTRFIDNHSIFRVVEYSPDFESGRRSGNDETVVIDENGDYFVAVVIPYHEAVKIVAEQHHPNER